MADAIVVINAGSSSLKFSLFLQGISGLQQVLNGQVEGLFTEAHLMVRDAAREVLAQRAWGADVQLGHDGALEAMFEVLQASLQSHRLLGIGHRVVHGGARFSQPVRIDAEVLDALRRFESLAPLHQPHNLAPIAALMTRAPDLPQVACFDTAFHRTNPDIAQMFGLPLEMFEQGIRRYGFHGLSYEYIASVLPSVDARAARGATVVMHLGNGASLCALKGGASVASTMGFTAVDGLMMGTRTGSLDPGVVLYLMAEQGLSAKEVETLLYSRSGLLGVSGVSSDMRTLLASAAPRARLAIDLYCYRIRRELGSMVAALGGIDALVFTAGIGEHATAIRQAVCRDAAWLGVSLDEAANASPGPGITRLSTPDSAVSVWCIPTNEEEMIARHTAQLLDDSNKAKG